MQPDEEHHLYLKHWLLINYISKTTGGKIKGITIKYQISFIYFGNISKDQMLIDQNSWNDQRSVRWTAVGGSYLLFQKYYRNRNDIEMILGYA